MSDATAVTADALRLVREQLGISHDDVALFYMKQQDDSPCCIEQPALCAGCAARVAHLATRMRRLERCPQRIFDIAQQADARDGERCDRPFKLHHYAAWMRVLNDMRRHQCSIVSYLRAREQRLATWRRESLVESFALPDLAILLSAAVLPLIDQIDLPADIKKNLPRVAALSLDTTDSSEATEW